MGSLIAMDAEQKREANGRFGSGGGGYASHEKAEVKTLGKQRERGGYADYEKAERDNLRGWAQDVDHVSSMSGDKGRQARKLARDCMTGRFRP